MFSIFSLESNAQTYDPVKGCVIDPNGDCLPNTLLTAVPFLRIVPDARSGAMGDAGIGLSPDPNAMHFNASKLAFVDRDVSLSATYTPWLRELGLNDIYLAYLSGFKQIDELQAVGFSLRFFSLGDINFTDINGNASGTGMPRELELSAAYARKLSENFSAGLTAKYIHSNLASGQSVQGIEITSANSFAADISFTYKNEITVGAKESDLSFGLALTNIGSKVSYTRSTLKDFLPANLGLGAALKMALDDFNSLTFALDINKLLVPSPIPPDHPDYDTDGNSIPDYREKSTFGGMFGSFSDAPGGFSEEIKEFTFSLGAEYWYDNQFAVRAGYYYENPLKGDRQFLTVGLGLRYNVFGLNLSYLVPTNNRRNPLDNTLRFTMNFNLESFQAEN
jgi:hypothetical protein